MVLLWLWLAAVAPIQPLGWESPCAEGVSLKKKRNKKKKCQTANMKYGFFLLLLAIPTPQGSSWARDPTHRAVAIYAVAVATLNP